MDADVSCISATIACCLSYLMFSLLFIALGFRELGGIIANYEDKIKATGALPTHALRSPVGTTGT